MKRILLLTAIVIMTSVSFWSCEQEKEKRVLIFSKTLGYRHKSIPVAREMLVEKLSAKGIKADTTENSAYFITDSLKKYSAVIFLMTSGNVLDHRQQAHFQRYIQAGGGYAGIHSAVDTEYNWPWYNKLAGAYFSHHPHQQEASIDVIDTTHISTQHLPRRWTRFDEWYDFKDYNEDVNVLALLDETTYEGGQHGDFHPIAWYHEFDGGRAFYTAMGHTDDSYAEPLFQQHILGGIKYAIGDNQLDYNKATASLVPEENRFVKQVLINNLNEPMELEVFRDGKVLFIERKGAVKLYDPDTRQSKQIATMDVHTQFEDGLLGLALDPDYFNNHWIYLYYSPAGEKPIQRLSRFVFIADSLIMPSEKTILEVPVQREKCCHTGGSIEFGPEGYLYLSTGDDTSPFNDKSLNYNSDGYAPQNEMPGWEPYDAQRSSGNTNDLRGKILRINVHEDATYSIPPGNLFPPQDSLSKPEIYVMGCRNPYRISIDQKTGILYYGDVGPDAGEESERGPAGHDELNQVKQAGNFGWPFFVADNKPYSDYNYATGEIGEQFDPAQPVNPSVNNNGHKFLPLPQPAMIYYPYAESEVFEDLATGGRNAMAGPVYYADRYPFSKTKLPDYYSGKLFFYDWMRDWIMAVSFDENNNFLQYEPFLPNTTFSNIVDITIAPDGTMYMLEYGTNWFSQNMDATLSRIDYAEGNRAPIANLEADNIIGAAPLTVNFSAQGSFDFDEEDELEYQWFFLNGDEKDAEGPAPTFTFEKPGTYIAKLVVIDEEGDHDSDELIIQVGNEIPEVEIAVEGNRTFYWPGRPFSYQVRVQDKEDGQFPGGNIPAEAVNFTINYVDLGKDETLLAQGHQQKSALLEGMELVDQHNCFACHKIDEKSIGPTYLEVADRYDATPDNVEMLIYKIIQGGSGNWGEQNMSAHPQISQEEAAKIIYYILALNDEQDTPSQPLSGSFSTETENSSGYYTLIASYQDKGGEAIGPLQGKATRRLRSPQVELEAYDSAARVRKQRPRDTNVDLIVSTGEQAFVSFDAIDLTNIGSLQIRGAAETSGMQLEVRKDSLQGSLAGVANIPVGTVNELDDFEIEINETANVPGQLFFVIKSNGQGDGRTFLDWVYFRKKEVGL